MREAALGAAVASATMARSVSGSITACTPIDAPRSCFELAYARRRNPACIGHRYAGAVPSSNVRLDPARLLADLDPEQEEAVRATSGAVAIHAGAGSGKTRVISRRTAYAIEIGRAHV